MHGCHFLLSVSNLPLIIQVKVKFECFGTHCDDKETEVTSDYVIVTSPAPLTTSMKFSPPIRLAQWHGLRIMKYLTPVKVILVFKDQWWKEMHEKLNFKGGITTDMSFQQLWFPPEQPPNGNLSFFPLVSLVLNFKNWALLFGFQD